MSIKIATVADTGELTKLVNSAYRGESSKQGWTTESHLLDGQRIDDEMMLSQLQDEKVTLLKYLDEENVIIGCVYLEQNDNKLYVGMLTVSPGLQGKGIGKQLLQAAEQRAKELGCRTMTMTVITTRLELIAWYERQGYRPTGEVKPFPVDPKFGVMKQHIELGVFEKKLN